MTDSRGSSGHATSAHLGWPVGRHQRSQRGGSVGGKRAGESFPKSLHLLVHPPEKTTTKQDIVFPETEEI